MARYTNTIPIGALDFGYAPAMLQSSTDRYVAVYFASNAAYASPTIYSAIMDDPSAGWTETLIRSAVPIPDAPQLMGIIQETSDETTPGRIHAYFANGSIGGTHGELFEVYSDDDGSSWSSVVSLGVSPNPLLAAENVKTIRVMRLDTGRWMFAVLVEDTAASTNRIFTFYSDDYGSTFSDPILHDIEVSDDRITLEQARYGKVIVGYINPSGSQVDMIYSKDRGKTWDTDLVVYSGASADANAVVAELRNGDLICAFNTDEDGSDDIKLVRSTDGGMTWGNKVRVYPAAPDADAETYPSLLELNDGIILCAFSTNEGGGTFNVKLVSSNDRGYTWGSKVTIAASGAGDQQPSLIQTADGTIYCAYSANGNILLRSSTDGGATWSAVATQIDAGATSSVQPEITKLSDESLVCVYSDNNGGDVNIVAKRSTDDGATWGQKITIVDTSDLEYSPTILELSNHTLVVVFSTLAGVDEDIYAVYAPGYTGQWSAKQKIMPFLNRSDRPFMTELSDGRFMAVFHTDDGGTDDIRCTFSYDGIDWDKTHLALPYAGKSPVLKRLPNDEFAMYVQFTAGPSLPVVFMAYDENFSDWSSVWDYVGVHYSSGWNAPTAITEIYNSAIVDNEDNVLFAFVEEMGATDSHAVTILAETPEDFMLAAEESGIGGIESYTGMEAPQCVVHWDNNTEAIVSGDDGDTTTASDQFDTTAADFSDVLPGDRLIIDDGTANDGVYQVYEVTSATSLKIVSSFPASLSGLDFRIVRSLPDYLELRRKEFEYPNDLEDGNRVLLDATPDDAFDTAVGDYGRIILTATDGATNAVTLDEFTSASLPGSAQIGDWLIVKDDTDIENNGIYVITGLTGGGVEIGRNFPLAAKTGLTFDIYRGPFPYRTYYYTLFEEGLRDEPLFGRYRIENRTWCFAGGIDTVPTQVKTFKTKLWELVPKVYRKYDFYKEASSAHQIIENNEVIYRESSTFIAGHLERLARFFGLLLQRAEDLIANFRTVWSVKSATPDVLEHLAYGIGYTINRKVREFNINRWRKFLKVMLLASIRKGTSDAVIKVARFYGYTLELSRPSVRGNLDSAEPLISANNDGSITLPAYFDSSVLPSTQPVQVGDLLKVHEPEPLPYTGVPTVSASNGLYLVTAVDFAGHDIEVQPDFPSAIASLDWTIYRGFWFDFPAELDSYSLNWSYLLKIRLFKDGVYQLWEEPETQFVVNQLLKFLPFNIELEYNEEAP